MYHITKDYIRTGNSRSGQRIGKVKFIVSHDTGNSGSTAYQNWKYFNNQQPSASAHTFIDDKYILEMIPLTEKAWHVQYNKPKDNQMFGADANDAAIGVELCWGGKINFQEAYKRYVWYHVYLCKKYNLDPKKHIVSHKTLDPGRKTDPDNALNRYGITWEKFINDVVKEFQWEPQTKVLGVSTRLLNPVAEKGVGDLPLKVGDKGEGVQIVHQQLAALGYIMQSDKDRDIYDDWTAGKVKQFQQDQQIRTQNGVYDYYTARAFAQVTEVYRKHWLETNK